MTLFNFEINEDYINILVKFASNVLNPREYITCQKTIINGFKDMYQTQYREWITQNKFKNHFRKVQKTNLFPTQQIKQQRLNWLNKYLINDQQFFKSNVIKEFVDNYQKFIELGFDLNTKQFKQKYMKIVILIQYHLFKLIYEKLDQKIKEQFKTFRFREK